MWTRIGVVAAVLAVAACGGKTESDSSEAESSASSSKSKKAKKTKKKKDAASSSAKSGASAAEAPPPAKKMPAPGQLAKQAFAPNVVLLDDTTDGGKIGFYQVPKNRLDRLVCQEPMGSSSEMEMTLYRKIEEWKVGATIESDLNAWGGSGGDKPAGKAKITITEKDPAKFRLAGTIELSSDDGGWKLSGPFEGDYCPTKVTPRPDPTPPLAGMEWTKAPVDAEKLPTSPIEAIFAGNKITVAHATLRAVVKADKPRLELLFFATKPSDPCAKRPEGGWLITYADDGKATRDGAKERIDTFAVYLANAPAKGDRLSGANGDVAKVEQLVDADLSVFESDPYRSWRYSQYWSASVAIDELDDKEAKGRVYAALPDSGKSMVVGAFTATRCPAVK